MRKIERSKNTTGEPRSVHRIAAAGPGTEVEVADWGPFRIMTLSRGRFRLPRTYLAHTGQFNWEVDLFDSVWGFSHRRAIRRLLVLVNEWAAGTGPPLTQPAGARLA